MAGNVHKAQCGTCRVLLPVHYQLLKKHALSQMHVNNSREMLDNRGFSFPYQCNDVLCVVQVIGNPTQLADQFGSPILNVHCGP